MFTPHITKQAPRLPSVRFKHGNLFRRVAEPIADTGKFRNSDVPFDARFCVDMLGLQAGWEEFKIGEGRVVTAVPYGSTLPEKPSDKAGAIATVPVCSASMPAELVIDSVQINDLFGKLYNQYLVAPEATTGQVPWVSFSRNGFAIIGWDERPASFGDALLPPPKGPKGPKVAAQATPKAAVETPAEPETKPQYGDLIERLAEKARVAQAAHEGNSAEAAD
jgi:hypothetical protein